MRWLWVAVWFGGVVVAAPAHARPMKPSAWPGPLSVSLSAGLGAADFADVRFHDRTHAVQRSGAQLALTDVGLAGAEGEVALASEVLRFAVGFAFYVPRSGEVDAPSTLDPTLRVTALRVARWFAELGLGYRFGDFTPFLTLRAAAVRTVVGFSDPDLELRSVRLRIGPRLGFRAHLRGRLFLQAAASVNLRGRPDPSLTVGVGVGER